MHVQKIHVGKKGHKSDVCRNRLADVANKKKERGKKSKDESEDEEETPILSKRKEIGAKKRLRTQSPAKVQKVKKIQAYSFEEEEEEEEEDDEEEEEE